MRERRAQVDTLNEVSGSLLELVPWRVREGLDKLVSEDNERYKMAVDTTAQHVDQIDAAILKSQQVLYGDTAPPPQTLAPLRWDPGSWVNKQTETQKPPNALLAP